MARSGRVETIIARRSADLKKVWIVYDQMDDQEHSTATRPQSGHHQHWRIGLRGLGSGGRNPPKGAEAMNTIRQAVPGGQARFGEVDLANLGSIAGLAAQVAREQDR